MLNFKTFFKISKKYIRSCIIYVSVYIVLMLIMSSLGSSQTTDKFKASTVDFTVLDEDQTASSQALIDYLSQKHNYVEYEENNLELLQDNLYYENIQYVLTIPEGYEEKLLAGETEHLVSHAMRTDSAAGYFFNEDVNAYFSTLTLYLRGGFSLDEALTKTASTAEEAFSSEVSVISFEQITNGFSKIGYYFQYYSYILVTVMLLAMAPILMVFHKKDLAERINCSSLSSRKRGFGIGLGAICYSLLLWLVFMVASLISYGPSKLFTATGFMMILNSLALLVVVVSLTLLIGSFDVEEHGLNLIANTIGLGSSFICGVFVPLWMLSDHVIAFSRFLPFYWYINSNNMLAGFTDEAFSATKYAQGIGIQLLFAVAFFTIYLVVSMQRKRKELS